MATRCVMMLDCVDARAKSLLKKHAKNRPLGDIQAKHKISLLEPQLLVEPLDVNLYMDAAKPYRVMSAHDIIEDQHRLLEQRPRKRTAVSAPVRRRTQPRTAEQLKEDPQIRDIISVSNGYMRPVASADNKRSVKKSQERRPRTTGNVKRTRPEFMKIKFDRDLLDSARNYHNTQQELRRQFEEPANITDGTFVRGKKKPESVDGSGQWLTFGGGSQESNGGIIDAFTSMKEPEEYFIVEGSSGSHLVHKMKGHDKVRIGKNGVVQPTLEPKVKRDKFDEIYYNYEAEYSREIEEVEPVPLCWQDQVSWDKVKVIQPSGSKENSPRNNQCDTHPVKFDNESKKEQRPKLARPSANNNKYRVQTARKSRHRLDGIQTSMDELSIQRGSAEESYDPDYENPLRYEEVIEKAVAASVAKNKKSGLKKRPVNIYQYPRWQDNYTCDYNDVKTASPRDYLRSVSKLSMAESAITTAGEMRQHVHRQVSTPMHLSEDPELSIIAPGQRDKARPETARIDRSPSPMRPTTATPLHRTSARAGSSITPYGMQGETEFIKIARSMKTPHHSNQQTPVSHIPSGRQRYIIQVEDTNKGHYNGYRNGDGYGGYANSVTGYGLEPFQHPLGLDGNDSDNTNRFRMNTPVSFDSRPLSPNSSMNQQNMSVNVPTGGATSMASSEVNSMSDFLEFEVPQHIPNFPQHTPIPEENNSFVESMTSSKMGQMKNLGSEFANERPGTVLSRSVTSRPSTATSLKSDSLSLNEEQDSVANHDHDDNIQDGRMTVNSNKLNGSELEAINDSDMMNIEVTITKKKVVGISQETRRLIESVSSADHRSHDIQQILDERNSPGIDDPSAELKKLRDQIKSELQESQIDAEADLQDMYMQHQP